MSFKAGDEVEHRSFGRGVVRFGPFDHFNGTDHYLMEQEDGTHATVVGEALTPAPVVFQPGDRVRWGHVEYEVKHGPLKGYDTWYVVNDGLRDFRAEAEELTFVGGAAPQDAYTHDGVTYDLSARYRDQDGDNWRFERRPDGVVRGTCSTDPSAEITEYHDSLPHAVRSYGPLTKL
ncbi:phiSA1p31-related protein [Streptomyces xanthophaeus]